MTKDKFLEITGRLRDLIAGTPFEGVTYAVGGSVRDYVMGNEIKDIDLVVAAPNGGVGLAAFMEKSGATCGKVVTYPAYGTAMFRLREFPGYEIECVQTRGEQYRSDSRNPETRYATIEEDCVRRDLTINALYYNLKTGEVEDFTGKGLSDMRDKLIRVTNDDPDVVFNDDPLRILRVIRFATRFGWKIDPLTYESMKDNAGRLSIITQERITDEFSKILLCKYPDNGLELIDDIVGIEAVMPEFAPVFGAFRKERIMERLLSAVLYVRDSLESRLSAVLHMFNAATAAAVLRRMKYSNDVIEEVLFLIDDEPFTVIELECGGNYDLNVIPYLDAEVSRLQYVCRTPERYDAYVEMREAASGPYTYIDYSDRIAKRLKRTDINMFGYVLPVDGNDVMEALDAHPSPAVGAAIGMLMDEAFKNNGITRDECLHFLRSNRETIFAKGALATLGME